MSGLRSSVTITVVTVRAGSSLTMTRRNGSTGGDYLRRGPVSTRPVHRSGAKTTARTSCPVVCELHVVARIGFPTYGEEIRMSDKIDEMKGPTKEAAGALKDDDDLKREGKADQ